MKKAGFSVFLCGMVLALATFVFVHPMARAADQKKTITVGVVIPVTGVFAAGLRDIADAAKPVADFMNKRGGVAINGQKYLFEAIIADDQSSPSGAVAAVNKLVQDKVNFIIPPFFIPNVLATTPITTEAKILCMKPAASGREVCNPNTPYSFVSSTYVYNTAVTYDHLRKRYPKAKRIAIVSPDDPGVRHWTTLAKDEIQKHGLELAFDDRFRIGSEDYYPMLTKALEKKIDAIDIVGSIEPWSAGVINQSRELGFKGPVFSSTAILGDINLIKGMVDQKYATDIFHAELDPLSPKMTPIVKEFRALIEARTKRPLTAAQLTLLDAVYVLAQGIEKAQSLEADNVKRALEEMKTVDTINGKGRMAGEDYFGLKHVVRRPIAISGIQDGKVWCEFTSKD